MDDRVSRYGNKDLERRRFLKQRSCKTLISIRQRDQKHYILHQRRRSCTNGETRSLILTAVECAVWQLLLCSLADSTIGAIDLERKVCACASSICPVV